MNAKLFHLRYLTLVFVSLLGACSGGNVNFSAQGPTIAPLPPNPPPLSSEAVTTRGVITGSAGFTVNGVNYASTAAAVTINDQPGTLSDLRQGLIVIVRGRINGDGRTGTASSIRYDANLIGPVDSADAANNRLIAMGQTITTDSDTLFGPGIDPATFAGLAAGNNIRVSGFADAGGAIRATRIDMAPVMPHFRVPGPRRYEPGSFGSMALARLSRIKKPHMSVIVVRMGPEASAGSKPLLRRSSGRSPPRATARRVFTARAPPTTRPR